MVSETTQALYFGAGSLYFAIAFIFAFKKYKATGHEGFWFFMVLFTIAMADALAAGAIGKLNVISEDVIRPYHGILFLIASIMLFTATYTLHKKHHDIKIF